MKHFRALAALAVSVSCHRTPERPAPRDAPRPDTGQRTPATAPDGTNPDPTSDGLEGLLALAFQDSAAPASVFDRLIDQINTARDPKVVSAAILAATRRAPTSALARVAATITPDRAVAFARALSGRPRSAGPAEFPSVLLPLLQGTHASVAAATVVSRFRFDVPELPPGRAVELIRSSSLSAQTAGARLLASRSQRLPTDEQMASLTPFAIALMARPVSGRTDVPPTFWVTLLQTVAARARAAPRLWYNAWRAVRDAAPTAQQSLVSDELRAAIVVANDAGGLPTTVLARLRCENAVTNDRLVGDVQQTLTCASGSDAPIALAAQAEVLGSTIAMLPAVRAARLAALIDAAHGDARTLVATATAATALPPPHASALLRRLARERDPAVMAALMEGISDHPVLLASLPPAVRLPLLHAAFDQAEGPTLEARVQAIRLARLANAAEILDLARPSRVRALEMAANPDAGVRVWWEAPPTLPRLMTLRVTLEFGSFDVSLPPRRAPRAAQVLIRAASARRYDGLTFHRIVPSFVVQGGDPRGDGYGGTDEPIRTELSLEPFERGTVGIPLAGLDTGGMQMFVVTADAAHLDGRYPAVGHVSRGIDVVDGILPGDRIESVEVIETPR